MINYRLDVFKNNQETWDVLIFANGDKIGLYLHIKNEDDAYLVGEAFIDGIKFIRGDK